MVNWQTQLNTSRVVVVACRWQHFKYFDVFLPQNHQKAHFSLLRPLQVFWRAALASSLTRLRTTGRRPCGCPGSPSWSLSSWLWRPSVSNENNHLCHGDISSVRQKNGSGYNWIIHEIKRHTVDSGVSAFTDRNSDSESWCFCDVMYVDIVAANSTACVSFLQFLLTVQKHITDIWPLVWMWPITAGIPWDLEFKSRPE